MRILIVSFVLMSGAEQYHGIPQHQTYRHTLHAPQEMILASHGLAPNGVQQQYPCTSMKDLDSYGTWYSRHIFDSL